MVGVRTVPAGQDDADAFLGGCLVAVRDWWEDVEDVHGDIRIYTSIAQPGSDERQWVEYRVRSTNGVVQDIEEVGAPHA